MSIHGHDVLHYMLSQPDGFTKSSLIESIHIRFGAESRFHTCSAEEMTAEELIDFLEARGKFHFDEFGVFNTSEGDICDH